MAQKLQQLSLTHHFFHIYFFHTKLRYNPLTSSGNNSTQENSPRNSPDFATSPARLSWPACSRHTAACMHRFFHILWRPGEPAVWFMSESGAVGSWQARTYVGLPITSSGFETAADVRGLIFIIHPIITDKHLTCLSSLTMKVDDDDWLVITNMWS